MVKYGKKVKVEIIILISILVLGCLLFFLFIQDGGITGHVVKEDDKKIQIGVLIPLTGKYASLGEQVRYGYEIAVFDFNINSDYKLNLIYEDTGSDINKAITGAQKLLNVDKVNILLGPFSSGAVLAIAPTTELAQKILFTPIASSSEITHAGEFVFRNRETGSMHGKVMAEFLVSKGIREVAVMQAVSSNAVSYSASFVIRFKELGGELVHVEKYNSERYEFKTEVMKVIHSNSRVVYLVPTSVSDAGIIVKELRDLGFEGVIASTPTIVNQDEFFRIIGRQSAKIIITVPILDTKGVAVKKFVERYRVTSGINASVYAANGYDAVRMLGDAVVYCKGDNPECIKGYLYLLTDYPGVAGKTSFDRNGDVVKKLGVLRAVDGTFV